MSSELRERMINHMMLRNYSDRTIDSYVEGVVGLVKHYWMPPEQITEEMIQSYLELRHEKVSWGTNNVAMYGIRYLYKEIIQRKTNLQLPPRQCRKIRRLPKSLSVEEVRRLFEVTTNLKHRTILMTLYGTGIRSFELTRLKPEHVEYDRGLVRVHRGKGQKDRYTILPQMLAKRLRQYGDMYQSQEWLFPGQDGISRMKVRSVESVYQNAKRKAGITHGRGPHTLRHCFATHLMENGYDIVTLKQMLGHRALSTTAVYIHVSRERIKAIRSPLDELLGGE